MADEMIYPEPTPIESLTRESLKGKSVAELEDLHQRLTSMRTILQLKLELVHAVKEDAEQIDVDKKEADKWSPEKRARMTQVLGGSHITKDEVSAPGETTK